MAKRGLRTIRFRPFNHTGPGQVNKFVVPEFAAQIAAIEKGIVPPVIKVGNLETKRDFTDVRDIVSAYVLAASNCGEGIPSGIIMNLSSGTPRRIGDILYALLDLATVNIEIVEDPVRMRASDVPYAAGDSSLAGQVLDWRPKIEWAYTLQSVLDDWRMRI
jgi:GDP-4-dehydro-6-deoxy-D-mannose reductase